MIANDSLTAPAAAAPDFGRDVHCVLGLPFDALTLAQARDRLLADARAGRRNFFSTPNLNFLVTALAAPGFRDSVLRSDLSLADGMPIIWMARALGIPLRHRVAGSTVFELLRAQRAQPLGVYFFGGPDGVARRAGEVLNAEGGALRCVGAHAPGFGSIADMSAPALLAEINAARPDFVLVALGAKRGQQWIEHNLAALEAPLISHLGAVINFVAGTVAQAPSRVGGLGLEWLWRIKEEPALWRRYWHDGLALAGNGAERRLTLGGDWHAGNLAPLREALAAATAGPADVTLDLAGAGTLDAAAVALLMLLYGHQSRIGRRYAPVGASAALRRALAWQCADYLLTPLPAHAPAAPRKPS